MDASKITAYSRADFRAWLEKNHSTESKVFVVKYRKHTGKPSPSHMECMHEAICFGWIDTTIKKLDENRYGHYFVKRGPNASWSYNTRKYARELIAAGKMAPAGLEAYKLGLKKKTHDHGIPKNPPIPDDLKKALSKSKTAEENFKNLAPSYRRTYLRWLFRAKMPETRKKRIAIIVEQAKGKKKWGE